MFTMELKRQGNEIDYKRRFLAIPKNHSDDLDRFIERYLRWILSKEDSPLSRYKVILGRNKTERDRILSEERDLPWYFDELARLSLLSDSKLTLTIKACGGFYQFFDVVKTERKWEQLTNPFFVRPGLPSDKELTDEQARGVLDVFLMLAPELVKLQEEDWEDFFQYYRLSLKCERLEPKLKEVTDSRRLEFSVEVVCKEEPDTDKYTITYFNPPKQVGDDTGDKKGVVIASPNIRDTLWRLSEVWQNHSSRTVCICAGSGSGKEVLVDFLRYGMCIGAQQKITFSSPQLGAAGNPLQMIYDEMIKYNLLDGNSIRVGQPPLLFFDEIHHKVSQPFRVNLLRLLEDDILPRQPKDISLKSSKYVFAASQRIEELRQQEPIDFWTRIEHLVEMTHPLILKDDRAREQALRVYFLMFWENEKKNNVALKDQGKVGRLWELDGKELRDIATKFSQVLNSPLIPTVSIRMLRSLVGRIFSRSLRVVRQYEKNDSEFKKKIRDNITPWMYEGCRELLPKFKQDGIF